MLRYSDSLNPANPSDYNDFSRLDVPNDPIREVKP
jgi:hypothetical protein